MAKLGHFKNSKVSMGNFVPILVSYFTAYITPPDAIINETEWSSGKDLIIEQITKITGLDVEVAPSNITQEFKGSTRNFAGGLPENTSVTFTIDFNLNLNDAAQNFVYKAFRKWSDLIFDPLTGAQRLKKDYVSPSGIAIDNTNKIGEIHRRIELKNVFISKPLPSFERDYSAKTQIDSFSVTFTADYFNSGNK